MLKRIFSPYQPVPLNEFELESASSDNDDAASPPIRPFKSHTHSPASFADSTSQSTVLKRVTFHEDSSGRQAPLPPDDVEYYEIPVDFSTYRSLHSVAMHYNCSVWELKRANQLHSAEDYFACQQLRIPAMKNSFRAELLQRDGRVVQKSSSGGGSDGGGSISSGPGNQHTSNSPSSIQFLSIRQQIQPNLENNSSRRSGGGSTPPSPLSGQQFLRSFDRDLERICAAVRHSKSSLAEAASSLTENRIYAATTTTAQPDTSVSVIFGLKFRPFLLLLVFFTVVLPLIIIALYLHYR